jgi:serine/threonine protein kinase
MPLNPGTRLGPYEILAPIGAGGMGEVYKAKDTRLDRTVAVKLSSEQFSERFEREARAVAALNHPNICILYDVGPNYLVMEFISGQSLDHLIPPSGMRLADAFRIAIRVADGLAAAHKAGIIHRDLKPGNIMVTDGGAVKLLDFGLAAIHDSTFRADGLTETLAAPPGPKTAQGTIVGTCSYMSPEQAEGRKLDPRSDIFSFGSVFYEMLTGQRAFRGDTTISTLAAILTREPKPPAELAARVPPEAERIVARCLRKDPDRRFQHASDLRVELQELAEAQSSGALAVTTAQPRRPGPRRLWTPFAVTAALLAGLVAGWVLHRPPPPFQGPKLTRATFDSGLTCDPALSADNKLLAYASDRAGGSNLDIWVQPASGGDPVQLTHDDFDDSQPSFSPDGSQLVYRSERDGGGIYVISALGGQPRLLAREGRAPRFSPDGSQIVYWTGKGGRFEEYSRQGGRIFVVPAAGGEPRQLAPEVVEAASPIWSPDGRTLLFVGRWMTDADRRFTWFLTSLTGNHPVATNAAKVLQRPDRVLGIPAPSQWLPANQIVFADRRADGANLYRMGIDADKGRVSGQPQQLTFGGGVEDSPSVAGNGLIAMADLTRNLDLWSLPIDARTARVTGEPVRLSGPQQVAEVAPNVSADGRKLAYTSIQPQQTSIWVRDLPSGRSTRLVSSSGDDLSEPKISSDGSLVAYWRGGSIFTIPSSGGLGVRVLDDTEHVLSWTRSGKIVHFEHNGRPKVSFRVAVLDPPTHTDRRLLEIDNTETHPWQVSFSPDETLVTFITLTSPQTAQVFVAPVSGAWPIPKSEWIAVTDGTQWDDKPNWSPDGNILYMTSERDGYRCLWARRIDPRTHRPIGDLFPVRHFHSSRRSLTNIALGPLELAVAPDRLVFGQGEITGNIWLVNLR